MSTIVTRAAKGSPLTHAEVDANFTNLNTDKVETNGGSLTNPVISGGSINNTPIGQTTRAAGSFTTLNANGNVTLGDATSDTVTVTARFVSDLVPSTTNTRALGSSTLLWSNVFATAFTEAGVAVVSQIDIGSAPNQVPLNQYLGSFAYLDADNISYSDRGTNGIEQNLAVNRLSKVTITADTTLTTTVPKIGSTAFVLVVSSGVTSRTVTFGTGFKAVSTLETGTTSGVEFVIQFISDGSSLIEVCRNRL